MLLLNMVYHLTELLLWIICINYFSIFINKLLVRCHIGYFCQKFNFSFLPFLTYQYVLKSLTIMRYYYTKIHLSENKFSRIIFNPAHFVRCAFTKNVLSLKPLYFIIILEGANAQTASVMASSTSATSTSTSSSGSTTFIFITYFP